MALETDLRAEIAEMLEGYLAGTKEARAQGRRSDFSRGRISAINHLVGWLDEQPDGWVAIEDELPPTNIKIEVTDGKIIYEAFYKAVARRKTGYSFDDAVAWRLIPKAIIPERFRLEVDDG